MANDFYQVLIWDTLANKFLDKAVYACIDGAISITATKLIQFAQGIARNRMVTVEFTHCQFNKMGGLAYVMKNDNIEYARTFSFVPSLNWDAVQGEIRNNLK